MGRTRENQGIYSLNSWKKGAAVSERRTELLMLYPLFMVRRSRQTQKLTKQTAEALVLSTQANIEGAEWLLTQHNFTYMLPGVFADEALKKFFGQARQRNGVISTLTL